MITLRVAALAVFLLLATSFASVGIGQEKTPGAVVEQPGKPAVIPETLKSPRATMETFLHAMNDIKRDKPERISDAVTTLDLSSVNPIVREERGSDLAWMLLEVMDRTKIIKTERIPGRTKGKPYLFKTYRNGSVRILRMEDGRWLFDSETIKNLPQILDELSDTKKIIGTVAYTHSSVVAGKSQENQFSARKLAVDWYPAHYCCGCGCRQNNSTHPTDCCSALAQSINPSGVQRGIRPDPSAAGSHGHGNYLVNRYQFAWVA